MNHYIVLLIRQLELLLSQLGRCRLQGLDISPAQSFALFYLFSRKGEEIYAVDLHEQFGFSKAAVSVTLKDLEEKGYLETVVNPRDSRKKQLILTGRAWELKEEINRFLDRQEAQLCEGIPPETVEQLRDGLTIMLSNAKQQLVRRNETC